MKLFKKCLLLACTLYLLSACALREIKEQVELIEDKSIISGFVELDKGITGSVYVRLYQHKNSYIELVNQMVLNTNGSYQFHVLPGRYLVAAYIDQNSNQHYERTEPAVYEGYGQKQPDLIDVQEKQHYKRPALTISGPIQKVSSLDLKVSLSKTVQNIGKIVNLNDPMFGDDNASMGLWRPLEFVQQFGGGLLMLQDYDKEKIPVIFVHGIMGNPLNFEAVIKELDRDKFQPWVLYYPSGMRLDMVSDHFLKALNQLYAEYRFSDIQIIAHSMGGLMCRSFLMKQQIEPAFEISLFVTINSPLYGMDSAASGVKHSPIVIPSWRDVATDSDYVRRVHEWQHPSRIPYHLFFSYLKGEDGDGVVSLSSQLSLSLQEEAVKIYGFNARHAGILKQPEFISRLNSILSNPEMKAVSK